MGFNFTNKYKDTNKVSLVLNITYFQDYIHCRIARAAYMEQD